MAAELTVIEWKALAFDDTLVANVTGNLGHEAGSHWWYSMARWSSVVELTYPGKLDGFQATNTDTSEWI